MRVRCHLREIRGARTLADIAALSGVKAPELSRIERGLMLPADTDLPKLAVAYGAVLDEWYDWEPPQFLVIELDQREAL